MPYADIQKRREHTAAWRRAHPAYAPAYREAHREAHRAYDREYNRSRPKEDPEAKRKRNHDLYLKVREKRRVQTKAWWDANPGARAFYLHRYRAKKLAAAGACTRTQLQARIEYYGSKCWVPGCGKPYEAIDHVIALSKGGSNWPANLRPICKSHNSQKRDRSWAEFLRSLP